MLGIAVRTVQRYLAEATSAERPIATSPCAISGSMPRPREPVTKNCGVSLLDYARRVIGAISQPRMEPPDLQLQLWSDAINGEPAAMNDDPIARSYERILAAMCELLADSKMIETEGGESVSMVPAERLRAIVDAAWQPLQKDHSFVNPAIFGNPV